MKVKKMYIPYQRMYGLAIELQEEKGKYAYSFSVSYNGGGFGRLITDEKFIYNSLYDLKVAVRKEGLKIIRKNFNFNKKMIDELNGKLEATTDLNGNEFSSMLI
jgi:hypothetical protein